MTGKRDKFRLPVPHTTDIFLLAGNGLYKYRLLDFSETGLRFLSNRKLPAGAVLSARLNFPWLNELLPLKLKVARSVEIGKRNEGGSALAMFHGADWEVGGRFVDVDWKSEEKIYHQIRLMDWQRRQSVPAELEKPALSSPTEEELVYE